MTYSRDSFLNHGPDEVCEETRVPNPSSYRPTGMSALGCISCGIDTA